MSAVAVSVNSNMLAHGTRPAATPRKTTAPTCSTQASTVIAMRERGLVTRLASGGWQASHRATPDAGARPGHAACWRMPAAVAALRPSAERRAKVDGEHDEREGVDRHRRVNRNQRIRHEGLSHESTLTLELLGMFRRRSQRRQPRGWGRRRGRVRRTRLSSFLHASVRAATHMRRRGTNRLVSSPAREQHREQQHGPLRGVVVHVERHEARDARQLDAAETVGQLESIARRQPQRFGARSCARRPARGGRC